MFKSISDIGLFNVINRSASGSYYGCDQEWFSTEWQRQSGCGPVAAANIIFYLNHKRKETEAAYKTDCSLLMEEVWNYVTPTSEGIPSAEMFGSALLSYTKAKGLTYEGKLLEIPEEKYKRPGLLEIIYFIDSGLTKDMPVAFLNLCNGNEKNLEGWHWVTVVSLEYDKANEQVYAGILDEGLIKRIDLKLWYDTTSLGGGFVYLSDESKDTASEVA